MARGGAEHPLIDNAAAFVRWRRKQLGWSVASLAVCCETYGQAQEPPVPSSLTRTAIAKFELGDRSLLADEAYLVAGALGVSMTVMLTNNIAMVGEDTPPGVRPPERATAMERVLLARVGALEQQVVQGFAQLGVSLPAAAPPEQ